MSGIAGILVRQGGKPAAETEIQQMLARMSHRARDGSSWWMGKDVVLGHAWLDTTGETSAGPVVMADGKLAITADSRLDNRDDLLAALGLHDRSISDAALILNAYLHWGEACPEYLLGDFAFAIRDAGRQTLFCARDHFGVKPFYYHSAGSRFIFASEIKPVLGVEGVSRCISEHQIASFLAGLPAEPQATSYTDIFRLPARHSLTVTNDRVVLRRYWEIEPSRGPSRPDSAEEFRHLFTESVRSRMRGAKAVGAMLSGGLDSSSIACVARGQRDALPTFSLVFEKGSAMDERQFIDSVLEKGGFDSHFIPVVNHAPFAEFEQILEEQEGNFLAPGLATTRGIYRAAGAEGIRVLLDGHGGDEVVSHGHGRLHELAVAGRWLELWRELRGASDIHGTSIWQMYFRFLATYGPAWRIAKIRRAAGRLGNRILGKPAPASGGPAWRNLVNSELADRTDLVERFQISGRLPPATRASETLTHRWMLSGALVPHAFEVLDKAAANFGVEPRYPFWDKRLVELCLSLPAEEKLKNGWTRLVLRRAMEGILPPMVQWRRDKIDFKANLVAGMIGNHRQLLETVIGSESDRIAPYVNLPSVAAAHRRLLENSTDAAMEDVQSVWRSVQLSLWLRQVQSNEVPA